MPSTTISHHAARHVFLVGFMGTGKSTTGTLLAARIGRTFVDLDTRIEQEASSTVTELFASGGEAAFREHEARALRVVIGEAPQVIAVGGGAVAHHGNLELMLKSGVVICLRATPETILERVGGALTRPLLAKVPDKLAEVKRLLFEREPFYRRAHLTVDTDGLAPSQVATRIVTELQAWR
jgi:shikimate kinase